MTTRLTASRLARLREATTRTLPNTCTIERPLRLYDGAGGWIEQWSVVATVPCRLDPIEHRSARIQRGAGEVIAPIYRLSVPWDTPIQAGDRAVVGGTAYRVQTLTTDHDWRVARRAIVMKA